MNQELRTKSQESRIKSQENSFTEPWTIIPALSGDEFDETISWFLTLDSKN